MKDNKHAPTKMTPRENFLMSLLNKMVKEYKALLTHTKSIKPFKIVEIIKASSVPGESKFAIQITNTNSILQLTAADIICKNYDLSNFSVFHAQMITQAAQGKLLEFLNSSDDIKPNYKIISKKIDRENQQHIFTIECGNERLIRTSEDISKDKELLSHMDIHDVYDLGYTHGAEAVLKEKLALLLAKKNNS